jgi:hypothetical protein
MASTAPRARPELWAAAGDVEFATTPCGFTRDDHGRPVEPRAALSVLTPEGNLAFLGTASELDALARRFAAAARAADPTRPAADGS